MPRKSFYQRLTDEELLEIIKDNVHAENEFYRRYKTQVKWHLRKYRLNNLERDDLMQEGMIGLFNAIETFDKTKKIKFSTYANTCIRNRVQNKLSVLWNQSKNIQNSEDIEEVAVKSDPEQDVIIEEVSQNIQQAVLNLDTLEKNVLERYLEDKTYIEIAKELEIPRKKVDNILMKVKSKLAQSINKENLDIDTSSWKNRLKNSIQKGLNNEAES